MAEYYEQRASAGLIITEATSISEEGHGWLNAPQIATPDEVAGWKSVTDKVHAKGGHIYVQLWHMGRQAHSSFHPTNNRIVSASNIPMTGKTVKSADHQDVEPEVPEALSVEDIQATIQDFVQAAKNAQEAGFDGIELHSANGYLIDQFLQSCSNTRTDQYGGSMENRLRLLKEIVDAIIESGYPANRIGFRLSPNGSFGSMGSEDNYDMFQYVAKEMNPYGLAYMHVMDGLGFGFHGKTQQLTCAQLRKHWDGILMCNVGLTKEVAEGMVRSGASDLCAFGRLYISNPDLPERFANNYPLADSAPYDTWWEHTGAKGYTDWATYPYKPSPEELEAEEKKEQDQNQNH
jgi:2,4-dienoyl-CoA reductase-like NADH-dependent reductase (Old Yellow Enzyme family)